MHVVDYPHCGVYSVWLLQVTVGRDALKTVYMSEEKTRSVRRRRWRMLLGQGLLQPADYEIRCNGDVDADLLVVVRVRIIIMLAP